MKTLIIGGSGFVGSRLVTKLDLNKCYIFDKNPSPFFNEITTLGNILDKKALLATLKNIDTVVLLAAEHRDDVSPVSHYYDVNVTGTRNVVEAMDNNGVKNLIFTSSVAVYGLNKSNPDEVHPIDPFNHYGKSKWQAEEVIRAWYYNDPKDKSVTIIRPTVIFGERNRGNVYNLLKQIASGKFLMIGKGQNKKSMAYVGNVVSFIKDRIDKNERNLQIFNYVDKPDFNMTELVRIVQNKMKVTIPKQKIPYWIGMIAGYCFDLFGFVSSRKLPISSVRVKKFCATTEFNAKKAHSVFSAPYTLEDGLNKTLEHEFINPQEDNVLFFTE